VLRNKRYVIYGAGGIGGVIGARLFQAGFDTTLIARGEHARALREQGLKFVSPQGVTVLPVPTVLHPRDVTFSDDTVVLMCMKSQHCLAALEDLAAVAPTSTAVACVQNGVANEPLALRYFANVYATVVILPAMYLHAGEVVTPAEGQGGILDTGCFPNGLDETARQINMDLTAAGFSARPDAHAMRQKYAKLLSNLANVMAAGLQDLTDTADLRRMLRNEALACYAAAGIDCATNEETKARLEGVMQVTDIPGYERTAGSSWQSMTRGTGDIETDYLNGEICWLGRLHDIPTPANDACVELARELVRANKGPGILSAEEFSERVGVARV